MGVQNVGTRKNVLGPLYKTFRATAGYWLGVISVSSLITLGTQCQMTAAVHWLASVGMGCWHGCRVNAHPCLNTELRAQDTEAQRVVFYHTRLVSNFLNCSGSIMAGRQLPDTARRRILMTPRLHL
jgi:hypothetical protein